MKLARLMDAIDVAVELWPSGVRSYVRRAVEKGATEHVGAEWLEKLEDALVALLPAVDGELADEVAKLLAKVKVERAVALRRKR